MSLYPPESRSPEDSFRADRECYWLIRARLSEAGFDLTTLPALNNEIAWKLWVNREILYARFSAYLARKNNAVAPASKTTP